MWFGYWLCPNCNNQIGSREHLVMRKFNAPNLNVSSGFGR